MQARQTAQRKQQQQERCQSAKGAGRPSRSRKQHKLSTQHQQAQPGMCPSASPAGHRSSHRQRPPHRQQRSGPRKLRQEAPAGETPGLMLLRWQSGWIDSHGLMELKTINCSVIYNPELLSSASMAMQL